MRLPGNRLTYYSPIKIFRFHCVRAVIRSCGKYKIDVVFAWTGVVAERMFRLSLNYSLCFTSFTKKVWTFVVDIGISYSVEGSLVIMKPSLTISVLLFTSFLSVKSLKSVVLFNCTFEGNSTCSDATSIESDSHHTGLGWKPFQGNRSSTSNGGPTNDVTTRTPQGYFLRSYHTQVDGAVSILTSNWSINIGYHEEKERYANIRLNFSFFIWKAYTESATYSLRYSVNNGMIKSPQQLNQNEWTQESIQLNDMPSEITFTSLHISNLEYSGIALDDVTVTADLLPTAVSPTAKVSNSEDENGPPFDSGVTIIVLACLVGFLFLIIVVLICFILLRKKREGEFTPVGLTVANSTYDLPSTISGINTSENTYFKYGTYSGERYPPVSPASDVSLPFTKVSKKKRKDLTLPLRTSQATGTFEYKGVSPMASPSPQSPDSVSSKLYVQKRSKLGLLGRAQAMIYGSPKPMTKRLSRSLPDNLEWTLSGYARGPYQITDLINGRFELKEMPSPHSDTSQHPNTERSPSVKSPQIILRPPENSIEHYGSEIENNGLRSHQRDDYHTQERVVSNQHNVVNEHFKERTLDRSTLTLPLNVKRPSWDADKYEMIFDSGDDQCELLDLLQGSSMSNNPNVDENYEPVLAKQANAVSRNNNGRSSRGSSSSQRRQSDRQTPNTPKQASREEVYEMVSPVDQDISQTTVSTSTAPDGSTSTGDKEVTSCPAEDSDRYEVARRSSKKKPHFKIEKRKVSFSNKTCIIERPPIDSEDYDGEDEEAAAYYGSHHTKENTQPPFPLVAENGATATSNGGYVNVRISSESDREGMDLPLSKEGENPSEYEMISPTTDDNRSVSNTNIKKDPNVYDELARDFPLKKNPRSLRGTPSNYNKIVMPDIVPSTETKARRRGASSDYDNVASPENTLGSPEGAELSFYHFTLQSPRGSNTNEQDTNSTGALSDDYEVVG